MSTTKTAATGKLAAIAQEMRQEAGHGRRARRNLPHGLVLVLEITEADPQRRRWRLAAGREKVDPSDMEVDIVRSTFGVPDSAEPQRKQVASTNRKSGRVIIWHVVEVSWTEVRQ